MRNPEGVWDWPGEKRNDLEALRMHLTNRGIYNYFKERIVVKSNKLAEVITRHGVTVGFMEDLEEPERGISHGKFPCFLKREDGPLNSVAMVG